jgi:hypothetical protein
LPGFIYFPLLLSNHIKDLISELKIPMRKLLPFTFILLVACNKQSVNTESKSNGIVNYTIAGDSIHIVDSASTSVAEWIYSTDPSKGYALQAYYAKPGGEVLYMISFYIKTDKIETGHDYSNEVSGTILRNSLNYASTETLDSTWISIRFNKQNNETLTGTFTGRLKNVDNNKLVEISGSFDDVRLIK